MKLYKDYPKASDRMGMLWALNGIDDACIIEFGPAGTTHFSIEGLMQFDAEVQAKTFTTHMDDYDVTFGNDERLREAILELDAQEKPKWLFVFGSSVSSIIGIDLESICTALQDQVRAKLVVMPDCDFTSDDRFGFEKTLEILVRQVKAHGHNPEGKQRFNLLGVGISDYNHVSDIEEVSRLMKAYFDMTLGTAFTWQTTTGAIEEAGSAAINLVVSEEGLEGAKYLKEHFNQPYVVGRPYGIKQTQTWLKAVAKAMDVPYATSLFGKEMEGMTYRENQLTRRVKALKNRKVFVAHGDRFQALAAYLEDLGFVRTEERASAVLCFDNGIKALKDRRVIQISHPSFHQSAAYGWTPMVGIRGSHWLTQTIGNRLTEIGAEV